MAQQEVLLQAWQQRWSPEKWGLRAQTTLIRRAQTLLAQPGDDLGGMSLR